MFTVEERESARRRVLERAAADPRIVAAAVVGAEAAGRVDRWSDLDLTFGVAEDTPVEEVLAEWTRGLGAELAAVHLFDVHVGPTTYRVLLLPGNLQVDLSFTPAARFGALGPSFRLLFGTAVEDRVREPTSRLAETPRQRLGLRVLYLLRARLGIERGNLEQAEHYLRQAVELLDDGELEVPRPADRAALLGAVQAALDHLMRDPGEGRDLVEELAPQLRELARPTLDAGQQPVRTMPPVATQRIWAPWRLEYVKDASKDNESDCIFCAALEAGDDEANLIVERGERAFVILNKFPYTNGHLMVAPYEHVAGLQELDEGTTAEVMSLAQRGMRALEASYSPHGYNVGFNQGRVAGAGVEHHIHMHVVPRWGGDTNFMPVLGDTRVMNQTLADSYKTLKAAFG